MSILILLTILYSCFHIILAPQFSIAAGYAAKIMCSCTFIAGRDQNSIQQYDLDLGPIGRTKTHIDPVQKSATSSLLGMKSRHAVFSGKRGCVLLAGKTRSNSSVNPNANANSDDTQEKGPLKVERERFAWNEATGEEQPMKGVDYARLKSAIHQYFDPDDKLDSIKTRAVVVIYRDTLIYERYANGFDRDVPILGWSMTKSITSTLIGILVKNDMTRLDAQVLFSQWIDDRQKIKLKDMLQMQSGLEFGEVYASLSDATKMLFLSRDVSAIPIEKPLLHRPGEYWSYSSGTTNLLSRFISEQLDSEKDYLSFPYDSLFMRIGMKSAVMETDESGLFIGSSFMYATPRDWAKFGNLYLNMGNWHGDQIIDSSWVEFVRTPASASNGVYGGQFWLNASQTAFPDAPADLYSCNGFQGQYVFIIPSYDMVIVRMGLAEPPDFDANGFLEDILSSVSLISR